MQGRPTRLKGEPLLLLDPEMDRAAKLAAQLELIGFPTRTECTATNWRVQTGRGSILKRAPREIFRTRLRPPGWHCAQAPRQVRYCKGHVNRGIPAKLANHITSVP
jgi:hypothetical protein